MKKNKRLLLLLAGLALVGCTKKTPVVSVNNTRSSSSVTEETKITIDTECDDKECVAFYLHTYDKLPGNYMTKKEARKHGWTNGALHLVVEGKCIGGDSFGNFEENLPVNNKYHECDIDTLSSKKRGSKRIIYSEDGDIWYTEDHYETFELLYGDGK